MKEKLGIYIHIPFCERKCYYCGFLSFDDGTKQEQEDYVTYLLKELEIWGREISDGFQCDSVFIGGGTPSLLKAGEIFKILSQTFDSFSISSDVEITIETNPNSLSETKLKEYLDGKANRLSIGVQSLHDETLRRLGRIHGREDALRAYEKSRKIGFDNINLDLMFGVPDQTFSDWMEDVREVRDLSPDHLSFYSIQLEEGTPYYNEYRKGRLNFPAEEEDRRMFHHGAEELKKAGYDHYEISNFGKKKCRHNLKYWSLESYLGVGLGASSYLNGRRGKNTSDFSHWKEKIRNGKYPVDEQGFPEESREETISVYCFTALRKKEGIDFVDFKKRFGEDFKQYFADKERVLESYKERGLLIVTDKQMALTELGIDISNEIMAEFI